MNKGKNVWIVKPAGLSRGRGIACYNNLAEIIEHIKIRDVDWVVQKYIENPLIILNRKVKYLTVSSNKIVRYQTVGSCD
jgi:Tubulin-tyrosine ligase family.